jgi:hypothetical protein
MGAASLICRKTDEAFLFSRSPRVLIWVDSEFQLRSNNRKNADIFGAAISGC